MAASPVPCTVSLMLRLPPLLLAGCTATSELPCEPCDRHAQRPTESATPAAMHVAMAVDDLMAPACRLEAFDGRLCFSLSPCVLSAGAAVLLLLLVVLVVLVLLLVLLRCLSVSVLALAGLGTGLSFGAAIAGGGIRKASCRSWKKARPRDTPTVREREREGARRGREERRGKDWLVGAGEKPHQYCRAISSAPLSPRLALTLLGTAVSRCRLSPWSLQ